MNIQYLDATSQNKTVTLIIAPAILNINGGKVVLGDAAIDNRMTIDNKEQIVTEIGADGTPQSYFVAQDIDLTLSFLPGSASVSYIEIIQQYQELARTPVAGTLIISDESGYIITYKGFTIKSKFTGFGMTNKVEDFTVTCGALQCIRPTVGGAIAILGS